MNLLFIILCFISSTIVTPNLEVCDNNDDIFGPSSVAAINTDFTSQQELDLVFYQWLYQFSSNGSHCEKELIELEQFVSPNLNTGGIVEVHFEVSNYCTRKVYRHIASFELVLLDGGESFSFIHGR